MPRVARAENLDHQIRHALEAALTAEPGIPFPNDEQIRFDGIRLWEEHIVGRNEQLMTEGREIGIESDDEMNEHALVGE